MRRGLRHLPLVAALLVSSAACGGASPAPAVPPPGSVALTAGSATALSTGQLLGLLLQPSDLPDLARRRPFASAALTSAAIPQLALCRPPAVAAPHQVANVIAETAGLGMVSVFEVVLAYPDENAARAAYTYDRATATACSSYQSQGAVYQVHDLQQLPVPAGVQALQYRLDTAGLTGGDVRSYAQHGRFTVLVTGVGTPGGKTALPEYQREVLRKALARL